MAEIAGLALGVLGIAGLFTSCIENFDIVIRAREFSEEFELLCTQLALQQIRFKIWGETLGLVPSPSGGPRTPYGRALERPDIRPVVEATLLQLRSLLTKADAITGRYGSEEQERATMAPAMSDSRGMTIFHESYQKFKDKIKRNQKEKSIWQVTRWSIHDYDKFERLVNNIRGLVDALESITSTLGILAQQQSRLIDEIESLSDASSLQLLQQVGSLGSAPPVLRAISDTASARLTYVTSSSRSYHTAKTEQSRVLQYDHKKVMLSKALAAGSSLIQYQAPDQNNEDTMDEDRTNVTAQPADDTIADVPQHQRWMAALLNGRTAEVTTGPSFSKRDLQYGEALKSSRDYDDKLCRKNSAMLAAQAHEGRPLARRMFIELRNIRRAQVSFISAAPVGDRLDRILASVEGPPGTPYEGGIFWLAVAIVDSKPPMIRFHTRVYHPNIDPGGNVCADYASWWRDASLLNGLTKATNQRAIPWFSEQITNHYSLGSLLVALCGLLANPNVEDPLVPEIAEKYLTDYTGYCEAARLYTKRFAHETRPSDTELIFPQEDNNADTNGSVVEYQKKPITESLAPQRGIADSTMIWVRISAYRLSWSKLEKKISGWFPDIDIVNNQAARDVYCVALPKPLSNKQLEEIHHMRKMTPQNETGEETD
ncbi:hypothetical protein M426DRAFT_6697 [Hypoxylon sp. CI-4A]|nr:hypothetical protein M426DRAFT_6697 [Hypoxylon sp. CI-4A]